MIRTPVMLQKSFWDKTGPVLMVVMVVMAFALGSLWSKVKYLEKGATGNTTANQPQVQPPPPPQVEITLDQVKSLFKEGNIVFGDSSKKVLFVEISDPSCPYCHAAGGVNTEIYKAFPNPDQFRLVEIGGNYASPVLEMKKLVDAGKAGFVWLYANGHGSGEMATKALYCAHEKGQFWPAHDLLMADKGYKFINETVMNDKTKSGEVANFLAAAVDKNFMKSCLDSGKYDNKLQEDMDIALKLNFQGTPHFLVNTQVFGGAYNYRDMESVVTAALK
ncbi:MAG: hypothetical protein UX46_C0002G0115 [Candidatus Amesbacteria bacterium GW2011_GWC1_46_24]|nr:MAG: hypothetical protein UX46_C0002G0115 [Candidatus Amesbacteria bacterium GW2011_GWC1_46_24]